MSRFMDHASVGNSANVDSQQSAIGEVERKPDLQPNVPNAVTEITLQRSSPQQTSHEYVQDGNTMQCDTCGFWYDI